MRSHPSVVRWVEFKFRGIGAELYTWDHVSNAHRILGNGY